MDVKIPDRRLIDASDSILIAIDVQPVFIHKLAPDAQHPLVQRVAWLIGVARWLQIPIVVTAEDIGREGTVAPEIAAALPPQCPIYDKLIFDLTADPLILAAVAHSRRRTCILVGLETDVCVAQSAVGLLGQGYRVAVVADATGAPGIAQQFGLDRVRQAGGEIIGVKGLYYEWIRTVERAHRFRRECPHLGVPAGIQL